MLIGTKYFNGERIFNLIKRLHPPSTFARYKLFQASGVYVLLFSLLLAIEIFIYSTEYEWNTSPTTDRVAG